MQKTISTSDKQESTLTSDSSTSDTKQTTENSTLYHPKSNIMEYITLVWLDTKIDAYEGHIENSAFRLLHLVNSVKFFADSKDCVNFIVSNSDMQIFMIVSDELCQQITLKVQELTQLQSIYVLCDDKSKYENWIKQFKKIKGLYTEVEPIYHALRRDVRQLNSSMIPISIITPSSTSNLDELDQSFMYSQLLKENFLEMSYDDKSKKEFVDYCRANYAKNDNDSRKFDQFEEEYDQSSSIWWYTRESFIYMLLNNALRCQNTTIILKMGFFLRDLHQQLQKLHSETMGHTPLTVYRGQGMSKAEFEKLQKSKGGLLSFNNFLSTSTDCQVAYLFADCAQENPDLVGVLFQMEIDSSISGTSYASLDKISCFKEEEKEVVFSMHTIFRIDEIEPINDQVWVVNLTLTSDKDPQLTILTNYMREEIGGVTSMSRIGQLMIRMNEMGKAKEIYENLLKTTPEDNFEELARCYNQLGCIYRYKSDHNNALSNFQKAIELMQKFQPDNHLFLATIYNNIGLVQRSTGMNSEALSYYEKSLDIMLNSSLSNQQHIATTYGNIAATHQSMKQYSNALSHYQKALEIMQKLLPQNHPDVGTIYNNMASMYYFTEEYSKAASFYKQSVDIMQKSLPSNHPQLAATFMNIGLIHRSMSEHSKALSYYENALDIFQKSLPADHPSITTVLSHIASIHELMGHPLKALSYFEKALEIRQKSSMPNHLDVAHIHNAIASIHLSTGKYTEAVFHFEKALEIQQKSLSSDHYGLVVTYNGFGSVHYATKEYSKALGYYEKALEIQQNRLTANDPNMTGIYNNMATVLQALGDYLRALSYYNKTLEIILKSSSPERAGLIKMYDNIGSLHELMKENMKAISYYEKALQLRKMCFSVNHPLLATHYSKIGSLHVSMGDYPQALLYYKMTLDILCKALPSDYPLLAVPYRNMADVYRLMGNDSLAQSYYEKACQCNIFGAKT